MKIEFDGNEELLCPTPDCNSTYLHHGYVDDNFSENVVYFMENIDHNCGSIPLITKVSDHDKKRIIDPNIHNNGHGDSLAIPFWCENCGKTSYLYIIQHKGRTQMLFLQHGEIK